MLISKGRAAAGTLLCLRWKEVSLLSFTSSEVGNGRGIPLARLWGQHSWPRVWVEGVSVSGRRTECWNLCSVEPVCRNIRWTSRIMEIQVCLKNWVKSSV